MNTKRPDVQSNLSGFVRLISASASRPLIHARVVLIRSQSSCCYRFLFKNSRVFRHCSRRGAHQQDGPWKCRATSASGVFQGRLCPAKHPSIGARDISMQTSACGRNPIGAALASGRPSPCGPSCDHCDHRGESAQPPTSSGL